jgi:electron transfer flavoprotein beta subunit
VKLLVCVKRVPLTGGRILLTADAQALDTKHLGFTISPHEECGVEEAVRLVEGHGGEAVALCLGPEEAVEQLRETMALGIDRALHLVTDEDEWDPQGVASAIVTAIRADEDESGPFDLIFFGNEAADSGNYQVGIRVAHALERPIATGLKGVGVTGADVRCEREEGTGRDVTVLTLPAVVSVKEGLNLPRFPSVPAKIRAQRKPVTAVEVTRPPSRLEKRCLVHPEGQAKQAEILGEGAAAAPRVVELLRELGVAG